jgi:Tol biopolymer transport system component
MHAPRFLSRVLLLTLLFSIVASSRAAVELITRLHPSAVLSESADGASGLPRVTPDGRFVLFMSGANNLTDNTAANQWISLYVHDRVTHTIRQANSTNGGWLARGDVTSGLISEDGRFVAFSTTATNLGFRDSTDRSGIAADVYQKDLETGAVKVINAAYSSVTEARGPASLESMTPDGRYVLFRSAASGLASFPDGNFVDELFVRDTVERRTTLVAAVGGPGVSTPSGPAAISSDAKFVLFYSYATNLTAPFSNFNVYTQRLWLRDISVPTNRPVLISRGATNGNRESAYAASMTTNASVIAFAAHARLEDSAAPNAYTNIYVRLMATDTLKTMPLAVVLKTNLASAITYVSPAGSRVAVTITPRVSNTNQTRLFVWDVGSDTVAEIDLTAYGALRATAVQPQFLSETSLLIGGVTNSHTAEINVGGPLQVRSLASSHLHANADGSVIVFSTMESLVAGDLNKEMDVYAMTPTGVELISMAHPRWKRPLPDMSLHHLQTNNSGTDRIAFQSFSDALVADDTNGFADIFTWSKTSGEVKLETRTINGQANAHSIDPVLSADGRWLAFISFASNLVSNDTNQVDDLFLKSLDDGTIVRVSEPIRSSTARVFNGVRSAVISSNGQYVAYAATRLDLTTTNDVRFPMAVLFDRTTEENIWIGAALPTGAQRPIAIFEPHVYFYVVTNVYAFNMQTRERTLIGPTSTDAAFTSDGSLIALMIGSGATPRIYTFDPATHTTNVVLTLSGTQLRGSRMSISDNKVISFDTIARIGSLDGDNTNDIYTVSVNNTSVVRLATTQLPYPRGSEQFLPRNHVISRDGARVFYVFSTNSPIDDVPRINLMVSDVASGASEVITDGADAEPAPYFTVRPILLGSGLAGVTTARDLFNSPFDKANIFYYADPNDSDCDTLPDLWERAVFGSLDETAGGDADNDGMSNRDEMLGGTDPVSELSVISIRIFDLIDVVDIRVRDASPRQEKVQYTEDLSSGVWVDLPLTQSSSEGEWIYRFDKLPNAAFFRVVVQP